MNENDLTLTDFDYAIADPHTQMLKAALPYMNLSGQRMLSFYIKWNELIRTMDFFRQNREGMMSICSLDDSQAGPLEMLNAIRPYAGPREKELIDILTAMQAMNQI